MMRFLKVINRFKVIIVIICLVLGGFIYNSIIEKQLEERLASRRTVLKTEQELVEKDFIKQYHATFIQYSDSELSGQRVLTIDLQVKIEEQNPIAFYAFVKDVEKGEDGFIVHMTKSNRTLHKCFFRSPNILFHLRANESIASAILNTKSIRPRFCSSWEHAPFLVVVQVDKIDRGTEDEDAYGRDFFNCYGEIVQLKSREKFLENWRRN